MRIAEKPCSKLKIEIHLDCKFRVGAANVIEVEEEVVEVGLQRLLDHLRTIQGDGI